MLSIRHDSNGFGLVEHDTLRMLHPDDPCIVQHKVERDELSLAEGIFNGDGFHWS